MALRKLVLVVIAAVAVGGLGAAPAHAVPFEITSFDGGVFEEGGLEETEAGSHPWSGVAEFRLNTGTDGFGFLKPIGTLRDAFTDLPPGLVGNPRAVPTCPASTPVTERCPDNSQVGVATLVGWPFDPNFRFPQPVYNMEAPKGSPALFKFNVFGAPVMISGTLRTGEDYGIKVTALNAPQTASIYGVDFVFWGVPADSSHDVDRGWEGNLFCGETTDPSCSNDTTAAEKPFLSLPTSCVGPVETSITLTTWEGEADSKSFTSSGNQDCGGLDFSPTFEARPTTDVADSPSGLDVELQIPQSDDPHGRAAAHLRDTVVTLPERVTVNPSSANGLDGCSPAEVDLHGKGPAGCPDASKIGTVEVETPVLDHPIAGAVYIANPYDNPFGSLLALYIAIHDEETGVIVKLAGEVEADPLTGRLTTTFRDNPQLPFERFRLHFFGGAEGALRTAPTCGSYATTTSLTPWSAPESGPPDSPSDSHQISKSPAAAICPTTDAERPNSPSFEAGTRSVVPGVNSPLVINLRREDGSQEFSSLTLTPPPGLVGKLAGIPYCPESALGSAAARLGNEELASPSCPAASAIGSVVAGAGAGEHPYYAPGTAYLAGPYKGGPISLAIVTPATAGPFDLGTIVVRTALHVDPRTAQITAVSDPIPTILKGIPLDVRSVRVVLDRPHFTLNPTSCESMSFTGGLTSTLGRIAPLQSRFQVGGCKRLRFKPRISLRLKGGTARSKYPALTAVVRPRSGDANISRVSVALPHSEFLAQEHIRTVCTRVQWAADSCPAAAIYGRATVTTPLLDYPLTGPVYLRSSDNKLPDLVPDLRGPAGQPIKLESAGRTDSIRGGIRNTFDYVPDAPFSKLVLKMRGGKKGLLVNSRDICKRPGRATVRFDSHANQIRLLRPPLRVAGC